METEVRRGIFTVAVVVASCAVLALMARARQPAGPKTLAEAAACAEACGLYWSGDGTAGLRGNRIAVSEEPLNWKILCGMCCNEPRRASWVGTVAVYQRWQGMMANFDPEHSVVWGGLFVYGDPAVIERLTGRRPGA